MCPVCREPMIAFELEGIEIDRCVRCGGTWLDAGELEQIAELAEVPAGPLSDALQRSDEGKRSRRRCPRCGRKLYTVAVGRDAVVEIDRCPRGHGLWFDAGEMKALVQGFAGGEAGVVADFFKNLFRHELDGTPEGE